MTSLIDALGLTKVEIPEAFAPRACFFEPMDCIVYLKEDVSYRAVRLSPHVTVLIDPYDQNKAVGVKIKGFRTIIERLAAILRAAGLEYEEVELVAILETAYTVSLGDKAMREAEAERRVRYQDQVRKLAQEAGKVALQLAA